MAVASYLLFVLGCLGAADILLFHTIAHGIRKHPDARTELMPHALRGPTYAALFLVVPNLATHGFYFAGLLLLLLFDVSISLWDFWLEPKSRRFFGGLPAGEYLLHSVMAMVFGALVAAILFGAGHWAWLPTRIEYQPASLPDLLRLLMAVMAVLVLLSGIQDAIAVVRLSGKSRRFGRAGLLPDLDQQNARTAEGER